MSIELDKSRKCRRCQQLSLDTLSLTMSTRVNTTSVYLCPKCLDALRVLWKTFISYGRK